MEEIRIQKFIINKLHGSLNFALEFKDNTLVLLGENGSCKTTIIKILFYVLSLQWKKLRQYVFESIEICIDDKTYSIIRDELNKEDKTLNKSISDIDRMWQQVPISFKHEIRLMQLQGEFDMERLRYISTKTGIPFAFFIHFIETDDENNISIAESNNSDFREIAKKFHILYLPTYRRIEQELSEILIQRGYERDENIFRRRYEVNNRNRNYTEMVEFGMKDVDRALDKTLFNLKELSRSKLNALTLGYLGEIVGNKSYYNTVKYAEIKDIEDQTITDIVSRVDETILSKKQKELLSKIIYSIKERGAIDSDHDKIVCHYFLKLYEFHQWLKDEETAIRDFVDVCKKYLNNKSIHYDSSQFAFSIISKYDNHPIKLKQLSSGEKQIVSLFSHLYLSKKQNYIVLIDEPELSLSLKWQKMFLQDVKNGTFCKGLVAVTHSPFIFDNELDEYAHGLEEFKNIE